jgi:hypothetical protein
MNLTAPSANVTQPYEIIPLPLCPSLDLLYNVDVLMKFEQ